MRSTNISCAYICAYILHYFTLHTVWTLIFSNWGPEMNRRILEKELTWPKVQFISLFHACFFWTPINNWCCLRHLASLLISLPWRLDRSYHSTERHHRLLPQHACGRWNRRETRWAGSIGKAFAGWCLETVGELGPKGGRLAKIRADVVLPTLWRDLGFLCEGVIGCHKLFGHTGEAHGTCNSWHWTTLLAS